jgi:hypothetical protein
MKKKAKPTPKQDAAAADAAANLKAAVDKASQPGYLNSIPAVQAILVELGLKTGEALANRDKVLPSKALEPEIKRLAGVFLGEDPSVYPLKGWNQPGGIDAWIRETTGFYEKPDAHAMMEHVFLRFVNDYYQAIVYAATPGVTDALAQSNVEILLRQYVYLLLGLHDYENAGPDEE